MVKSGITHRDVKGIQTKIQELQTSYGKACDFLRGSGAGILDEDIKEPRAPQQYQVSLFIQILQVLHLKTHDLLFPAAITKRCRYWDELHPVMSLRTCANPPVTRESTDTLVADL